MSKIITLSECQQAEILAEFTKDLKDARFTDGKFTYSKDFGVIDRKAKVYFTPNAYIKMVSLVKGTDKEIAWHGIVKRHESEVDSYVIEDIIVYPQMVTGATVNTDQEEYEMWLIKQEDEVYNNIRMQGHSHVNMSTSPSAVDNGYYDKILATLPRDTFYIFLITNKRDEFWFKIYDLENNIMFETKDVKPVIIGMEEFISEAKQMVKEKVYTTPQQKNFSFGSKKGTKKKKN